jgi:cystathionine gamma-lyase
VASSLSQRGSWGPSTRAIHAGTPAPTQGAPLLPGPVLAATYHLEGPVDSTEYAYGRDSNPSWTGLEAAVGALEGGECVAFASGMAAMAAVVLGGLRAGDRFVACGDGYPGIRKLGSEHLVPRGVEVVEVPTDTGAIVAAAPGAALVWVETPANPRLEVCDLRAIALACRSAGARLAVDNTVATPLGQSPLALGADVAMLSATKALAGHSDLLIGTVTVREAPAAEALRAWRSRVGAIPSPFEAWLAHRSLATLDLRLARQSANALAVVELLRARGDVLEVFHPGLPEHPDHAVAVRQMRYFGPLVGFTLESEERAQAFLAACELVAEATSFGGVHSTAERRARWSTDDVAPGFIRFSAGCEDAPDLLADVEGALARSAREAAA